MAILMMGYRAVDWAADVQLVAIGGWRGRYSAVPGAAAGPAEVLTTARMRDAPGFPPGTVPGMAAAGPRFDTAVLEAVRADDRAAVAYAAWHLDVAVDDPAHRPGDQCSVAPEVGGRRPIALARLIAAGDVRGTAAGLNSVGSASRSSGREGPSMECQWNGAWSGPAGPAPDARNVRSTEPQGSSPGRRREPRNPGRCAWPRGRATLLGKNASGSVWRIGLLPARDRRQAPGLTNDRQDRDQRQAGASRARQPADGIAGAPCRSTPRNACRSRPSSPRFGCSVSECVRTFGRITVWDTEIGWLTGNDTAAD